MEINNTVRLSDGRRGTILATPSGFLSNGSYEIDVDGQRLWVKSEDILYVINTEFEDDLNNYFEIIYDEEGIHMIPKKLNEITIFGESDELKTVEMSIEGERHKKITFHIGDTNIWTTDNPKPEEEEVVDEPKKHRII